MFLLALLAFLLASPPRLQAHHGGVAIDWDDPAFDPADARWQQEVRSNGYRIKYLVLPRNVMKGRTTRLVFEVQSVETGRYVAGLDVNLDVAVLARSAATIVRTLSVPESEGITGYYEVRYTFPRSGAYRLSFRTTSRSKSGTSQAGPPIEATFSLAVKRIDPYQLVGFSTIGSACLVTWLGIIIAIRRRLLMA